MVASNAWSNADTKVLQVLAGLFASQNRKAMAADLLEFALEREPGNPELMKALCGVYLMLERFADALDMVERYLVTSDAGRDRAAVLMVKGQALWALDRKSEAVAAINEYVSLRPLQ